MPTTYTRAGLQGTVIPRARTVDLGGGQTGVRQTLPIEIATQSKADLQAILRGLTLIEIQGQERLANPPTLVEVDGRSGKSIDQAERRTVTLFGGTLAAAAMRLVEQALADAIRRTSRAHSGALADIVGHWEWRLVTKGGGARRVSSANPPAALTMADRLVLMPVGVPYATNANQAADGILRRKERTIVTAGGGLTRRRRVKRAGAKGKGSAVGFLEAATARLKARPEFKQFAIYVAFTQRFKVSGERSSRQGSAMIVIRPRLRGRLK